MTDWSDLKGELDTWAREGQRATFWWRDDDAVEPTPTLDRLLDLAQRHDAPLMLAVIPARAAPALAERIAEAGNHVVPAQHGYAHRNHAPAGERKCELGTHRPLAEVLEELARGRAVMDSHFGDAWLPVMVPPWNRIGPEVTGRLSTLGYVGLSTIAPRAAAYAAPKVLQVNTHLDIMRWQAPRGFLGTGPALTRLTAHLRARRTGQADAEEPTGLLTHHLAHDAAVWDFLERLLEALSVHPAAAFAHPRTLFDLTPEVSGAGTRGAA